MARYSKSVLQQQFSEITNTNTTVASKYLELHDYDLNKAIDGYLLQNGNGGSKSKKKHSSKLVSLFEKYRDPEDSTRIGIDGTIKYLEDLNIDPEDPLSLTLAYFLHSPSMGVFDRQEFLDRWTDHATDLKGMKSFIVNFHDGVIHSKGGEDGEQDFHKMYDFTFGFLMEVENQKLLDYESAISYWSLLLPIVVQVSGVPKPIADKVHTRIDQWFEFVRTEYKRSFSKDSWSMFYLFFKDIIVTDPEAFKDYDEMAAWPSVLDEYIEYLRENSLVEI